jgi:hypothetical protein
VRQATRARRDGLSPPEVMSRCAFICSRVRRLDLRREPLLPRGPKGPISLRRTRPRPYTRGRQGRAHALGSSEAENSTLGSSEAESAPLRSGEIEPTPSGSGEAAHASRLGLKLGRRCSFSRWAVLGRVAAWLGRVHSLGCVWFSCEL